MDHLEIFLVVGLTASFLGTPSHRATQDRHTHKMERETHKSQREIWQTRRHDQRSVEKGVSVWHDSNTSINQLAYRSVSIDRSRPQSFFNRRGYIRNT